MARMIPSIPVADIPNKGERLVFLALKEQLPDEWVVRFHYPACWKTNGYLKDFEVDFIIIAPERGVMFLEVKSSRGFECERGQWYRISENGHREEARNPVDQVTGSMHRVIERLGERVFSCSKHDFPGIFGHMVVFPLGRLIGRLPESMNPATVLTSKDMPCLGKMIAGGFADWAPLDRGHAFTPEKAARVEAFFEENCHFIQVLSSDIDDDDRAIEELTRAQYNAFRHLLNLSRVVVSGPAGSGKTMIARWIASEYHRRGQRVLLLCYNRVLEAWLRDREESGSFSIRSFFSVCRERIIAAGQPFNIPQTPEAQNRFWMDEVPDRLFEILVSAPNDEKFDIILVDEAQDFHEDWWMSVQLLLRDPDHGGLYLFRDSAQSGVYGHGRHYPAGGVYDVELAENCRNTKLINHYCGNVIGQMIGSPEAAPVGVLPEINESVENPSHRAAIVSRLVKRLLLEGFSSDRIALLSPFKMANDMCSLNRISQVDNIPVEGGDRAVNRWTKGECLWASTIRSFKGLEADCVIITDLHPVGNTFSDSDLYVACSRAKHRLYLVPASSEGSECLRHYLQSVVTASEMLNKG